MNYIITLIHKSEEEISIWLYKFVSYDNIKVDITIFSNTKFRITRGYLSFSEPRWKIATIITICLTHWPRAADICACTLRTVPISCSGWHQMAGRWYYISLWDTSCTSCWMDWNSSHGQLFSNQSGKFSDHLWVSRCELTKLCCVHSVCFWICLCANCTSVWRYHQSV